MKKCPKCKINLPISAFCKSSKRKDGLHIWCKNCCNEIKKQQYVKNRRAAVRLLSRKAKLKKAYGITVQEYDELLKKQHGVCAICEKPETQISNKKYGTIDKLRVDHDHKTNRVRGLLCSKCNQGLGIFQDNFDFMLNACNYIFMEEEHYKLDQRRIK